MCIMTVLQTFGVGIMTQYYILSFKMWIMPQYYRLSGWVL